MLWHDVIPNLFLVPPSSIHNKDFSLTLWNRFPRELIVLFTVHSILFFDWVTFNADLWKKKNITTRNWLPLDWRIYYSERIKYPRLGETFGSYSQFPHTFAHVKRKGGFITNRRLLRLVASVTISNAKKRNRKKLKELRNWNECKRIENSMNSNRIDIFVILSN